LSQCGRLGSRLLWNTPAPPARLVLYLMAHDELTAPPFEPFGSRMPRHFTGYHVLGPPIASIEFGAGNMGGLGILPGRIAPGRPWPGGRRFGTLIATE
jgi:hypothetical protein